MKKHFTRLCMLFILPIFWWNVKAQPYAIGYQDFNYTDPARSNRAIPGRVYYPGTSPGANVAVAAGQYPVIIFGHGFQISHTDYQWLSDLLVPEGFIVAFPNTESGGLFSTPDHTALALDLSFLSSKYLSEGNNMASPFYNKILPKTAVMGHSMGAKAAVIAAAQGNLDISVLCNFAAAEGATGTGSMISSAPSVSIPSLIIAGAEDCVAPVNANARLLYSNLASSPKAYAEINGASHCNFVSSGTGNLCFAGEGLSCFGYGPFISNADQHSRTAELIVPWLKYWLKCQCPQWQAFKTELTGDSGHTHLESGSLPGVSASIVAEATIFCALGSSLLTATKTGIACEGEWYYNGNPTGQTGLTYNAVSAGNYTYEVANAEGLSASSNTISLSVIQPVMPGFTAPPSYCAGDAISPLPAVSMNGIIGLWSPALNNTATTTYLFTPLSGQCAQSTTLTINVQAAVSPAPVFVTLVYCTDDPSFNLPTSIDGITGSWSGSGVSANQFNPAMANIGSNNTLFTPSSGQCATTATASFYVEDYTPVLSRVKGRVILEGYYNPAGDCLMSLALNTNGLLPTYQPYNMAPQNYGGIETAASIPPNASDWILVQLRSASDRNIVVAQKACFISCSGYILDLDGSTGVVIPGLATGNYYITIIHRSHLAVMSSVVVSTTTLDSTGYDFTTALGQAFGSVQLKAVGGLYALFAGDYDGNGNINSLDYKRWYSNNATVNMYLSWDGNGSAVVNNLDYNLWYANRSKLAIVELQF